MVIGKSDISLQGERRVSMNHFIVDKVIQLYDCIAIDTAIKLCSTCLIYLHERLFGGSYSRGDVLKMA